ncbi:MAG: phytanoyl-CoA dioxygenase family protein [Candidatus Latescibacteria bacterium]|nr:phytanoyl-CoA dioxygenase family protein [Candidatus Latescibacterota bacterium]
MLTEEQTNHFHTLGFLLCKQLLSAEETKVISDAFDVAMRQARGGAPEPELERNAQGYSAKRQQVVPFFDYNPDVFYPLLDHEKIMDIFVDLLGEDFILTLSEGIIHGGGTGWHHDAVGPDGFFTMRAAIYLDPLGPDDGCLSVVPGSHCTEFREALRRTIGQLGVRPEEIPGRYPLCNQPGDVLFMNHKLYHAALSDKPGRRAIHINCSQNTTPERNTGHFEWLVRFLEGETRHWGRFYSDRLIATAGTRRQRMMARAIELGFGNTGPITHLQDLR